MANKNNKKTTKSKSTKPTTKAPVKNSRSSATKQRMIDEQERAQRHEVEKLRITGIIIFAFSLLFFFVAAIPGSGVWTIIHNAYIGFFGWFASIVFPILCLIYTFLYTVKKPQRNMTFEIISIVVIIMLIAAFIHIVENPTGENFKDSILNAATKAPYTFNGGMLGACIGWALLTLGKAPAIIVDLILLIVDIMILSKVTVNQFFQNTTKPVRKVVEKAAPYIEQRRERRKNNIDVFLDENPPEELDDSIKDNMNGEVISDDNATKKSKKAKKEDEDSTTAIINEINNATKKIHDKKLNKKENNGAKSIDDIVKNASQEPEEKDEKAEKVVEQFTVPKENIKSTVSDYKIPSVKILVPAKHNSVKDVSAELKTNASLLVETLASFGVMAEITDISRGPTVTRYELKPAAGVRISKITNLSDDIALNLAATHVRIEAPIPGKAAVGIEIPNTVKNSVSMRELIDTPEFSAQKSLLSAGLGKDIAGNCVYCNLSQMPHLLIAGTTGSGKSVCMNSIIVSILYRANPDEVKLLMIDPKKVEFSKYENIPHLLVPVVTDPRKASGALGWAVSEMLKRYQSFSDTGVRDIEGYNKYVKKHEDMEYMPKIVICIDELADLMMAAPKEVEDSICRLAQMARAAGMHLVIATQRPSVDVITGLIKANISSRIALTVSSQIDSRTILDAGGAEKLLGKGDMLYSPIGSSKPLRVQGCFISDEEVEELCDFIKNQGESQYSDEIQKEIEEKAVQEKSSPFTDNGDGGEQLDSLFEKAVDVVLESGRASTSFLQRKLGVGYSRGSKIMDQLEDKGVIGPQDGSKPREIRINRQQWLQMQAYDNNQELGNDTMQQMDFDNVEDDENEQEF